MDVLFLDLEAAQVDVLDLVLEPFALAFDRRNRNAWQVGDQKVKHRVLDLADQLLSSLAIAHEALAPGNHIFGAERPIKIVQEVSLPGRQGTESTREHVVASFALAHIPDARSHPTCVLLHEWQESFRFALKKIIQADLGHVSSILELQSSLVDADEASGFRFHQIQELPHAHILRLLLVDLDQRCELLEQARGQADGRLKLLFVVPKLLLQQLEETTGRGVALPVASVQRSSLVEKVAGTGVPG
mmetsp:Transcript_9115/g.29068  ORF Transcript_9115/g.29068 Transcript_9115/m.29068 type:complete len:245 (+) Transcript_9115:322-1056(+)